MKAITKIALFADGKLYKAGDVIETKTFNPLTMSEFKEDSKKAVKEEVKSEETPKAKKTTKK